MLAWAILIWTFIIYGSGGLFEYIPLLLAGYFLLFVDLIAFVIVLGATLRKESKEQLRRITYAICLLSFPLFVVFAFLIV